MSGDDKFMTRWVVNKGWKMRMQLSPECTLATTFKADGAFFKQILRWTRNTWRSDFKSLVLERTIWWRYPVQARSLICRIEQSTRLGVHTCRISEVGTSSGTLRERAASLLVSGRPQGGLGETCVPVNLRLLAECSEDTPPIQKPLREVQEHPNTLVP